MSKSTLSLIEDIVAYRDRISERADRDMLADVANELSSLNALKAEMLEVLPELLANSISHYGHPTDKAYGLGLIHERARAVIAKASGAREDN